jgi:uncharacterized RDD family membrane protein YckC
VTRPKTRPKSRRRTITTPEGLSLTFTLASRGARLGALVLDLGMMGLALIALAIVLGFTAGGLANLEHTLKNSEGANHAIQFLIIGWLALLFALRNGWFLAFELGPRGATPGKRITGLRIAARDGARLSTEMVLARNLLRDIEIFLPLATLLSLLGSDNQQALNWLAAGWFLIFALFPFFNRDGLRAGDLIAGTWVIEAPRQKLAASLTATAPAPTYHFSPADLALYGEYELQTLEALLRDGQDAALEAVAETICFKISWTPPRGPEVRAFLDAYYAALRAHLEGGLRFGQRKADKFDASRSP